eukprot:CAMPEP_0173287704 /NCGR_PEP_ID=MMETSP1143-20121109/9959_1 /TAXON_ID=483371 /ORGANISM="non described non described, Strain CCMP2298" /LENGTH=253 /DNA_ID=CAMNT_0014226287 /DNA_START=615 /DNA_END=1373 /DNA_ORIENTATION=-
MSYELSAGALTARALGVALGGGEALEEARHLCDHGGGLAELGPQAVQEVSLPGALGVAPAALVHPLLHAPAHVCHRALHSGEGDVVQAGLLGPVQGLELLLCRHGAPPAAAEAPPPGRTDLLLGGDVLLGVHVHECGGCFDQLQHHLCVRRCAHVAGGLRQHLQTRLRVHGVLLHVCLYGVEGGPAAEFKRLVVVSGLLVVRREHEEILLVLWEGELDEARDGGTQLHLLAQRDQLNQREVDELMREPHRPLG